MRGFILATLLSILYALIVFYLFRRRNPKQPAALMVKVYFLSLLPLVFLLIFTPPNLGFLPNLLVENNLWLDSAFAIFTYSASIFGGWLQLYNLADRGMSLRVLIDAYEDDGLVTPSKITAYYGAGKGIQWMYEKRVLDIQRLGLISTQGDKFILSMKGVRNASLIILLRKFYALEPTRELK